MMNRDPKKRPVALEVLQHWYKVKASLPVSMARLRLRRPNESVGEQVVNSVRDGISSLRYLFDGDVSLPILPHQCIP